MNKPIHRPVFALFLLLCLCAPVTSASGLEARRDGSDGPLGEWPKFTPLAFESDGRMVGEAKGRVVVLR